MTKKILLRSQNGQFLYVLLLAHEDLGDRIASKREVEQHIEQRGYLNLPREFLDSYESKTEEKWKTLLAFARADALRKSFLKSSQHDACEMTKEGRERLAMRKEQIRSGSLKLEKFTFWSPAFKKRMALQPATAN